MATGLKSLESIRNFCALTPKVATAGQPRREHFPLIAEAGFDCVINLALPEHPDSLADEGALVAGLGMSYCHLPVPFDAPAPTHLRRFCALLEAMREQRLFVHCIMNYRVSAFMYLYLMHVEGYAERDARSPIFERWQIETQWQALMEMDSTALGLRPRRDGAHRASGGARRESH